MKDFPNDLSYITQYYQHEEQPLYKELLGNLEANKPLIILPIYGYFLDKIFIDTDEKPHICVGYSIETQITVGKFTSNRNCLPSHITLNNLSVFTNFNRYKVVSLKDPCENKKLFIYYTGRIDKTIKNFMEEQVRKTAQSFTIDLEEKDERKGN